MFSNLAWFAFEPSHILVWLLIAAAFQTARRRVSGAVLTALGALALSALLFVPIGNLALRSIEDQAPRPDLPARIDGIVVLGEGLNGRVLSSRGAPGVGPYGGTLISAGILARRYPDARLVFTGNAEEVSVARSLFAGMGIENRVLFDARSSNTWENLLYAFDAVKPAPGGTWLLVAAAYHMPRAMAVADRMGWSMVPWASDYLTAARGTESGASLPANLARLDIAAHEALGLVFYRLRGEAR